MHPAPLFSKKHMEALIMSFNRDVWQGCGREYGRYYRVPDIEPVIQCKSTMLRTLVARDAEWIEDR